ncbi:MAG: TerD family protein [Candidatus Bruticola sp.]
MEIQRGFRGKLKKYLDLAQKFTVEITLLGPLQYSCCCMAFTSQENLYCSDYIIWSGHANSAKNEICYQDLGDGAAAFTIDLNCIPEAVQKLSLLINVEDNHVMKDIELQRAKVTQNGADIFSFSLQGQDFKNEKLIICFEVYKKSSEWRLAALSCGYNKNISEMLTNKAKDTAAPIEDQPKYTCNLNNCQAIQDSPSVDTLKSSDKLKMSGEVSAPSTSKRSHQSKLSIRGHVLSEPFTGVDVGKRKATPKVLPTKVIPIPIHRKKKNR